MRWFANQIMSRRAKRIFRSIRRHLPADGTIADQSRWALQVREFCFGRLGYWLANSVGLLSASFCPLLPRRYYTYAHLMADFTAAGLSVAQESKVGGWGIRRYLFVLTRAGS